MRKCENGREIIMRKKRKKEGKEIKKGIRGKKEGRKRIERKEGMIGKEEKQKGGKEMLRRKGKN